MSEDHDEALQANFHNKKIVASSALEDRKNREQRAPKPIDGRRGRTRGVVKVTVQLNVRVEQGERDFIIDEAREDGRTISEFLMAAVGAYVLAKGRTKKSA